MHRQTDRQTDRNKLITITLSYHRALIKKGVVYSSFLLIIISVFIVCFFSFNSLTIHHKNLPWVIFTKKWLLSYILPPPAVYVFGCKLFVYLSVCLTVFWCLDYSRINEQIFIKKFLWVGPGQRKKLLKERSGSYFGYKKSRSFRGPISMYF